jgi:hypothetical protein
MKVSGLVPALLGPALAATFACWRAYRGSHLIGAVLFVASILVGVWIWRGLAQTCAINESECAGGFATLLLVGFGWFLLELVVFALSQKINAGRAAKGAAKVEQAERRMGNS